MAYQGMLQELLGFGVKLYDSIGRVIKELLAWSRMGSLSVQLVLVGTFAGSGKFGECIVVGSSCEPEHSEYMWV